MTLWTDLLKVALLGTRRGQLGTGDGNSPLEQFLKQLEENGAEHQLLSAAGSVHIYQQIGAAPLNYPRKLSSPPLHPDPRPPCSPAVTRLLSTMLSGAQRSYMPELLQALQDNGLRLPPRLVPNILSLGFKTPNLRPFIIPLLSPADRQLAAGHPEWLYAGPAIDNWNGAREVWARLSPVAKTRLLQQLRDSKPLLARQLLESTWKAELDSTRTNLIKQLETGLSPVDEPFLEMALDDRSQTVRRQAAVLLALIPNSRLGQRMSSYVQHFLGWTSSGTITVRFPAVTPAMVRDGVHGLQHKNPAHVLSKQLIQMVGAVPLAFWTSNWHEDPDTIIRAVLATNWQRTLTTGFAEAAQRQNNQEWARAVLWARGPDLLPTNVIDVLDTADYLAWLDYLLAQGYGRADLNFTGPLFKSLRYRTYVGDHHLALALLPIISRYMKQEPSTGRANISALRTFTGMAYRFPVSVLPEAEALFKDPQQFTPPWQNTSAELLNILRFRRTMYQVISGK